MADQKISAHAAVSAVVAANEFIVNEAGVSKKASAAQVADYVHLSVPADISPAQLTANTNDWAPTGFATASVIRFTTDASRELTGIAAGSDGRRILLINVGSFPLILKHDNAGSTAANRFALRAAIDDDIGVGAAMQLWYDSTVSRWRGISQEALIGIPRVRALSQLHTVSATTPTQVSNLAMALEIGTFLFDYRLIVRAATAGVAPQFNLNFTGTGAPVWWFMYADLSATLLAAIGQVANNVTTPTLGFQMAQAENVEATTAVGNMGPLGGLQATAQDHMVQITGIVVATAAGSLDLWHGSETATATTVEVGSSIVILRTA